MRWRSQVASSKLTLFRPSSRPLTAPHSIPMTTILRNSAAVVVGLILGSFVNLVLIRVSPPVLPPSPGVDVSTVASMQASM